MSSFREIFKTLLVLLYGFCLFMVGRSYQGQISEFKVCNKECVALGYGEDNYFLQGTNCWCTYTDQESNYRSSINADELIKEKWKQ